MRYMESGQQETELKSILVREYGLTTDCKIQKITGGLSNENYLVLDTHNKYVARIARFAVENQTTNMVSLMLFAENTFLKIPRLFKTVTGQPYTYIEAHPLFLMSYIEGESGSKDTLTVEKIQSAGKSIAELHALIWQPETVSKTLDPHFIFEVYDNFFPKLQNIEFAEKDYFMNLLKNEVNYFRGSKIELINLLPKGILHNDLILGNIMFHNDNVEAIIDLEEVGSGIIALDLGRILSYWFFDPFLNKYNMDDAKIFLASYEAKRKLSDEERDSLELVTRFVAFRHSVYVGKLLYEKKLKTIRDTPDFPSLEYFIKHKLDFSYT
jgi:Ser/Thr protein kinase RdoA (MazF antagonist)